MQGADDIMTKTYKHIENVEFKKVTLKKRILSAIPAVVFMIIIFIYSSKTAVQSSASSDPIAEFLLSIYESVFGRFPQDQLPEKLNMFSTLVRKTAHLCEYALLAVLVSFHLYVSGLSKKKMIITSISICAFYACTDEFHQYFVEGRACRFTDICIDTIGSVIGTFSFLMITLLIRKVINHKN